ncbi:MAG TPA: FAD-dependent oxidoreductase [Candidatus Saccharimonadales bacterium]|nr:FAD-dependent oxidoreductase [Candidatus Saccharimonadales bacterium]
MNITIVGGGFGGVKTALELASEPGNQITLITDKPEFQYYPALYGAATGHSHLQSWVPLDTIFAHKKNVTVILDTIETIDPEAKSLHGKSSTDYTYETCVLALGTVTTYFGIKGLAAHSFGIKSADEIMELKKHIYTDIVEGRGVDKRYIVIGAGPTGVELAAALGMYLKDLRKHFSAGDSNIHVALIEAAPRVLPRMSEKSSEKALRRLEKLGVKVQTGKTVESADEDAITVSGDFMTSDTIIWTSGVANHPFYKANANHFKLAPNGRVVVDEYMQANKDVYIIGDNAATPFTGLAQTALHDALFIAAHLKRVHENAPLVTYKAVMPPVIVPLGENWAVCEWRKLRLSGWPASLLRRAADFMGYSDMLPLGQALGVWRARKERHDKHVPESTLE